MMGKKSISFWEGAEVYVYAYSRPGSSANTDLALVNVATSILKPIWEIAGMSSHLQVSAVIYAWRSCGEQLDSLGRKNECWDISN